MSDVRRTISPTTYRTLTLVALAALTAIVVTGAAVRLTGSGLGCEDWPTCEDNKLVDDFGYHGWIEFGNRLLTGVVSIAVIAAVLGSMFRAPSRRDLTLWSWGLVAGVATQIVLGGIVVRFDLDPRIVLTHFLVSMILVWNATILAERAAIPDELFALRADRRAPWWIRLQTVLSVAAISLGTIVTGSGPHTGSLDEPIQRLPFSVSDAARVHSITVIALGLVALYSWRLSAPRSTSRRRQTTVLIVLAAQATIGYVQYFTGVPEVLVAAHILGATMLWIVVIRSHVVSGVAETDIDGQDEAKLLTDLEMQRA
ncbi:MAG: heme A synthase [Acidobacteria bacterium]|nr:heme A synthase [Acidobacteriota bacterium]